MAYSKDSEKFVLNLGPNIWEIIDKIAQEKGFSNTRRYINSEVIKIAKQYKKIELCAGRKAKKKVLYQLPTEHEETYKNLSCIISSPVSTIIIMHLLPEILKHIPEESCSR